VRPPHTKLLSADLGRVASPASPAAERLPPSELTHLRETLASVGLQLPDGPEIEQKLRRLCQM